MSAKVIVNLLLLNTKELQTLEKKNGTILQ